MVIWEKVIVQYLKANYSVEGLTTEDRIIQPNPHGAGIRTRRSGK